LSGAVHGGQQPVVGAHVYLFAANTTGYGGAGIAASSGNASLSLLTSGAGTTLDSSGGATTGDYFVTTDASGNFSITGDYTCVAGAQVYLYALGGNPGSGVNSAAGLMAALGSCPGTAGTSGNAFSSSVYVVINEVSTVAAAYAMAGFATDATHVGSSGTVLAQTGIANAFANAANLETLGTGVALATTPASNAVVPQAEINTLGNILAACLNSTAPGTTACTTLLTNAESNGSTGTAPTDTATAAINIAHNPGSNIAALYPLGSGTPPFAPALTSAPNDFTIGLYISGGGLNLAQNIAVDGTGTIWVVNASNSVAEFANSSAAISPSTGGFYGIGGYTGIEEPFDVAIDTLNNAWISNPNTSYVTELNSVGTAATGSPFSTGTNTRPTYLAIDGSNNVWITNDSVHGISIVKLSSAGGVVSGVGYTGGGLFTPYGIAIDGTAANNVWVADQNTSSISEFSSAGVANVNSPYTAGGISGPINIAVDGAGHVWIPNINATITVLSNTGAALSGTSGYSGGGLATGDTIAMDGAGNAWLGNANSSVSTVSEFSNAGVPLSTSFGYGSASLKGGASCVAVDGSGDIWIGTGNATHIVELIGAGVPVVTPLAVGVKNNTLGTRP
jgi:hypothetical protein